MNGAGRPIRKVVVVGLDGLDPKIVERLMAAGELPHLAAMAQSGSGVARVATTSPAQTPVAWSTFATGLNPGGHGIFDFLGRDPLTYRPDLALNRYEQKGAWLPPKVVNRRQGTPVWDRLAASGVDSTILRCPCTYPATIERGRLLSGLGVPDLRGGLGSPTFYSTEPELAARESELVVRLARTADGSLSTHLVGPRNPKDRSNLTFPITIHADAGAGTLSVRSRGEPAEVVVRPGEWSDWLRVSFKAGLLQSIAGMVRFRLIRLEPEVELYASPVNFDPARPPFPISVPGGYAEELAEAIGTYYTAGMVEDHVGLDNGRIDEAAFLDQCDELWNEREAMMEHELGRLDSGLFYCLFDTPDRVQHLFWRFTEADHPANRGGASAEFSGVVDDQYRRADRAVGRALEFADDGTLVVALSDHGFGTFRRCVDLNAWLIEHGLLALRDADGSVPFPAGVDWSRTRAYAFGLGGIYLNLSGREGQGVVRPEDAEALKAEIARGLTGLVDGDHVAIRSVKPREDLYRGEFVDEAPDLVVNFGAGYRVSWESSLGGVAEHVFDDNRRAWSGDHIVDPALVPGVLLMNRRFQGEAARLEDLAPTILDALGAPGVPELEGRSLL